MKSVAAMLLMVVLVGAAPAVCAKTPKAAQNIILIGWDGAQRDHLKECLAREELPVLQQIASDGTLVTIDVLRRTDTKAGWAQILTGYEPEITGVFSNNRYQPIARGYTIFERLEDYFGPEEFVTAAVIGKKNHLGARGPGMIPVKMKKRPGAQTPRRKPAARRAPSDQAPDDAALQQQQGAPSEEGAARKDRPAMRKRQQAGAKRQPANQAGRAGAKKIFYPWLSIFWRTRLTFTTNRPRF